MDGGLGISHDVRNMEVRPNHPETGRAIYETIRPSSRAIFHDIIMHDRDFLGYPWIPSGKRLHKYGEIQICVFLNGKIH